MKQTLPSYTYCVRMAAQYVALADSHGHPETFDPERADIELLAAASWIRKSRLALTKSNNESEG